MTSRQSDKAPTPQTSTPGCKHLRVQIVAREEDAEFVECKECGEVFESSEFKDMSIEERATPDES
jgi:Zn ribbon nucleic-acid-binding protein